MYRLFLKDKYSFILVLSTFRILSQVSSSKNVLVITLGRGGWISCMFSQGLRFPLTTSVNCTMFFLNCIPLLPCKLCCMPASKCHIDLFLITWLTRFAISNISWKSCPNSATAETSPEGRMQTCWPCPFKNLLMLCSSFKSPTTDEKYTCCQSLTIKKRWRNLSCKKGYVCCSNCIFFNIKWSIP